jgi:hypothetical protein
MTAPNTGEAYLESVLRGVDRRVESERNPSRNRALRYRGNSEARNCIDARSFECYPKLNFRKWNAGDDEFNYDPGYAPR